MLTLLRGIMGLVLLVGWGVAAASLHVIRTPAGGFEFVTKNELTFNDTYVDARSWSSDDEQKHAALYARLKQLDKTDLLTATAADPVAETPADKAAAVQTAGGWYSHAGTSVSGTAAGRRP